MWGHESNRIWYIIHFTTKDSMSKCSNLLQKYNNKLIRIRSSRLEHLHLFTSREPEIFFFYFIDMSFRFKCADEWHHIVYIGKVDCILKRNYCMDEQSASSLTMNFTQQLFFSVKHNPEEFISCPRIALKEFNFAIKMSFYYYFWMP